MGDTRKEDHDPAVAGSPAGSDPHPALGRRLSRIAFGCCADESKPQPVWEPVLAAKYAKLAVRA